jgi:hypothetical protein
MLGILMLDTRFPRSLGDIGHPDSFRLPVCCSTVPQARPEQVVRGTDDTLLPSLVAAGFRLVGEGARALSTSCGFLARWQPQLQQALPVPVWSSALLKLPELLPARCGAITIESASLTPEQFGAVWADPATPVEGIAPGSALHRSLLNNLAELDTDDAQAQVLAAGWRLMAREPALQALVLEYTNLPPYAQVLRDATGLPVHDIVTLLHERMATLRP